MWTTWERRSATTRLLQERGGDYVLPIIVQDVDVPGIPSTIGHLSLAQYTIEEIAQLLVKKVNRTRSSGELTRTNVEIAVSAAHERLA